MPKSEQDHDDALDARRLRAAQNQSFFREVNERIDELSSRWDSEPAYLCECLDLGCTGLLSITPREYAALRRDPESFIVLAGHEHAEIEETTGRLREYLVVQKRGVGGEQAVALAPDHASEAVR